MIVWLLFVSYLIKRKIKKIIFEVISNTKIFFIIFSMKLQTTKILSNFQRRLENFEYGNGGEFNNEEMKVF